jgi:signal transduction histidine kinase
VRVGFTDDAADGPRATIDIEDSGPGVPPERRRLVANLASGTGSEDDAESGLAQARELLEYCGGTLTFSVDGSADLGGAHFQVILPVERS